MKLYDFELVKRFEKQPPYRIRLIGKVRVETRILWWRKTVIRPVVYNGSSWFFGDTGEYTPGTEMEQAARVWMAKKGEDL